MIRAIACGGLAVLALLVNFRDAEAGNNWSSAGSGCVVSADYTSKASVDPVNGVVAFAAGQTDTIKLTCPVTAWFNDEAESLDPNRLYATFDDDDGTTTTCRIWVDFLRDNVGATAGVTSMVGLHDGATSGIYYQYANSTNRQQAITGTFSHSWDSSLYHYWVIVEMYRANTTCNIVLNGVGLYYGA